MKGTFDGRVAIVTGAGAGLGREHALALAERGAKIVVNDFGGARDGTGGSSEAADTIVAEILSKGGEAIAAPCSVTDPEGVSAMAAAAMAKWGRIDILINNAGVLRDKTLSKMTLEDFRFVVEVHLIGAFLCTKAVWDVMRAQNYGRILMTSSASGLYGNFGQSNYGAAKMALVGLMNVLVQEGKKHDIRVNVLAPTAATRMTADLLPQTALEWMRPELIAPAALYLVGEHAPNRVIMGAGASAFAVTHLYETAGVFIADPTPEKIADGFAQIDDKMHEAPQNGAFDQTAKFLRMAAQAKGVKL